MSSGGKAPVSPSRRRRVVLPPIHGGKGLLSYVDDIHFAEAGGDKGVAVMPQVAQLNGAPRPHVAHVFLTVCRDVPEHLIDGSHQYDQVAKDQDTVLLEHPEAFAEEPLPVGDQVRGLHYPGDVESAVREAVIEPVSHLEAHVVLVAFLPAGGIGKLHPALAGRYSVNGAVELLVDVDRRAAYAAAHVQDPALTGDMAQLQHLLYHRLACPLEVHVGGLEVTEMEMVPHELLPGVGH